MQNRLGGQSWSRSASLLCLSVCLCSGKEVAAEQLPLWEAGFGIAPITFPDYRGSNQQSSYVLPLPYLIYRGDRLRVTETGRAVFCSIRSVCNSTSV
jgi:hypothetical protein